MEPLDKIHLNIYLAYPKGKYTPSRFVEVWVSRGFKVIFCGGYSSVG